MTLVVLGACILCLILLITVLRVSAFLSFIIISIIAGLVLGIPLPALVNSVNKGLGDTLGSIALVIVFGAMLGKLVAESGAALKISNVLKNIFGTRYLIWAMTLTGLIVGIPLYYNVGFVLLMPIIFSVAYTNKLPLVYVGLPTLTSLSVMHGFLPPHPSPMALMVQFNADMKTTFLYGMIIAIPAIIIAGPFYARTLKKIKAQYDAPVSGTPEQQLQLPGSFNSFFSSLSPVIIIALSALVAQLVPGDEKLNNIVNFVSDPVVVMLLAVLITSYTLGLRRGRNMVNLMQLYADAIKDISSILLIIGTAGILKQIFVDGGVSAELARILKGWDMPVLFLSWAITAVLRVALGSATIAGLTAVGIVYPLSLQTTVDPSLMVLAVGAGSLFCSHVNDTAFWLFKEYFGLSIKDTFRSWTVMETLVSVIGLFGVLALDFFLKA